MGMSLKPPTFTEKREEFFFVFFQQSDSHSFSVVVSVKKKNWNYAQPTQTNLALELVWP